MQRAQREFEQYLEEMNTYIGCLGDEHQDARSEAGRVIDEWDNTVRRFNNQ
jgi:hypothetical protein